MGEYKSLEPPKQQAHIDQRTPAPVKNLPSPYKVNLRTCLQFKKKDEVLI